MTEIMPPRLLMLFRHAKSSWKDTQLSDADRPLSGRGLKAAKAMGRTIAAKGLQPDLVLVSPARRAAETWEIAAAELAEPPAAEAIVDLYDFGNGDRLLDVIRKHGGTARSLMLVGHNPATEELAMRLAGSGSPELRDALQKKYPAGALAVFSIGCNWAGLADGAGKLTHFIRPKDVLGKAGA